MLAESIDFVSQQGIFMVIILDFLIALVLFHQLDDFLLVFDTVPELVHCGALRWRLPTQLHQVAVDRHHSLNSFDASAQGLLFCFCAFFGECGGELIPRIYQFHSSIQEELFSFLEKSAIPLYLFYLFTCCLLELFYFFL